MKKFLAVLIAVPLMFTACADGSNNDVDNNEAALESEFTEDAVSDVQETAGDVELPDGSDPAAPDSEVPDSDNASDPEAGSTESAPSEETEESLPQPVTYQRDGEYIVFGSYEQDGDTGNGPEPIYWEVVSEENGRMLVVSRYILDFQHYNNTKSHVTWEECTLRAWLNGDFIDTAFTEEERAQILSVTLTNPDNSYSDADCGNDTEDQVFCLSVDEIFENFEYNQWDEEYEDGHFQVLLTEATPYAIAQGVIPREISSSDYSENLTSFGYTEDSLGVNSGYWWLRSNSIGTNACFVDMYGRTGWTYSTVVDRPGIGVRPAMYLPV